MNQKDLAKKSKQLRKGLHELSLPDIKDLKAVAIKYELGKDRAPRITATGKGKIAEKILKLADEHNIPFFEDTALTELLSKLELEGEIPSELYTLVAEVLAFVYQLQKLAEKKRKLNKK